MKAGRAGTRTGFQDVAWSADVTDHKPLALTLQASRLARRFGLALPVATIVAEHAFRAESPR